jgi:hypothetical protein
MICCIVKYKQAKKELEDYKNNVTGEVVGYTKEQHTEQTKNQGKQQYTVYRPVIEYITDSKEVIRSQNSNYYEFKESQLGTKVDILYNPKDVTKFKIINATSVEGRQIKEHKASKWLIWIIPIVILITSVVLSAILLTVGV